ncbi:hypothetical protein [Amycolatopsis sp. DSM 110486]|uniref:hypothetical protein n=1 Tax=Amycolatopsis sp. DSM 110486 TaxID=2865832 RepID=UPI001C69A77B|nr:hypothetical protein [Amycolatopsis sp. DSM 110486]QYN17582.1 hypothetical protein K1T34_32880 [Amycolatopsis sp. DSM 110486]
MTKPATNLTAEQLAALREQAERETSRFVDPRQLTRVEKFIAGRPAWVRAIIGHGVTVRTMTGVELTLLDLAATAEPNPPTPPREPAPWDPGYQPTDAERAIISRRQAAAAEWVALRNELPVDVTVEHNYTSHRHIDGYVQGVDHILLRDSLRLGRLYRPANEPLCFVPSNAHNLRHFGGPEDRVPTCKQCLGLAYRITGRGPSMALMGR